MLGNPSILQLLNYTLSLYSPDDTGNLETIPYT